MPPNPESPAPQAEGRPDPAGRHRKRIGQRDGRGTRLSYTAAAVAVAAAVACDFPRDGAWLQTISTAI